VGERVRSIKGPPQLGIDRNGIQKPGYHKRTFERYVQPTFDVFKKIHENYTSILSGSLAKLRFPNGRSERAAIAAAHKAIVRARSELETERSVFRNRVVSYMQCVEIFEMKAYFRALCDYFALPDDEEIPDVLYSEESTARFVKKELEGGHLFYSSLTIVAASSLEECETIDEAIAVLSELLERTNRKFQRVLTNYEKVWESRYIV
jgi:hypothetical protein